MRTRILPRTATGGNRPDCRRHVAGILVDAAAHRGTSPHVARLMLQMADAILAADRGHFDPACTCYRGMEYVPADDCPACSYYGALTVRTAG